MEVKITPEELADVFRNKAKDLKKEADSSYGSYGIELQEASERLLDIAHDLGR